MEKEELLRRIEQKKVQIEKINKRIQKWENNKSEKGFIKEHAPWYSQEPKTIITMQDLIQARHRTWIDRETLEQSQKCIESEYENWLYNCDREIKYAKRDLEEAQLILEKYNNALAIKDEQAAIVKIPAIVEFLEIWKQNVISYILDDAKDLKAAYEYESELCDKHNSGWYRNHPEASHRDDYRKYLDMLEMISPLTKLVYSRKSENLVDMDKLNKELDKEKEARYFKLVNQVTKYVGEIKDASNLSIGRKSELNGVIIGEKGKCYVETIGAGGYNVNQIVNVKHGQCFHYRTIVKPIK